MNLCKEAKIKQHNFSNKELCEIYKEAIWESWFTCFSWPNEWRYWRFFFMFRVFIEEASI